MQVERESSTGTTSDRLSWNEKTLVDAYRIAGKRKLAWDDEAENALEAFAKIRASGGVGADESFRTVADSLRAAVAAGCDDPLIRYLHARFVPNPAESDLAFADKASAIANDFNRSKYPPIRRFYGCLRAAEASVVTIGADNKLPPRLVALRYSTTTNLLGALADTTTPPKKSMKP